MIATDAIDCVLFDLDGTLVDTAPDMVASLNMLRAEECLSPLEYAPLRRFVSHGAMGLLKAGMPPGDATRLADLSARFLEIYAGRVCRESRLFAGLDSLLDQIELEGWRWGVVTNKPTYLSEPLLAGLELSARLSALVCGDTLDKRKPDPDPVLHACELAGVRPTAAVYIGDDKRDMIAGRAAGCATVAAAYGYVVPGDEPASWGADAIVESAAAIASTLGLNCAVLP